ncbi:MAG: class I SAM-dependent methyltransferase [Massilia sp.]
MAGEGQGVSLALRRIWRAPALLALLLQLAALPLTLLAWRLLAAAGHPPSLGFLACLQGGAAAILSRWRALAAWWLPIQFLFPVILLGALLLRLPPWLFLAGFLVLLLLFWSTFRTQVPYYPSGKRVRDAVAQLLPADRAPRAIDIGSGLGGLVLDLAARRPDATLLGIELAPLPWLISQLRARCSGSRARFILGDYEQLDFADFDLVYAYLSPAAMSALWRKARAEMRPGAILLSYEFVISEQPADVVIVLSGPGPALYGWHF